MNYRSHLYRPLSKRFVDQLVAEIFANPDDFETVYKLIFDSDEKVAWRAAWAGQKISEKHPEWFSSSQFSEIATLALTTKQGGLQRGCLSIINNLVIPTPIPVDLLNNCYDWMVSSTSPISVQVLSMKLIFRCCLLEPDLKTEFSAYLENINFEDYSSGFKSAANNILKALKTKQFKFCMNN